MDKPRSPSRLGNLAKLLSKLHFRLLILVLVTMLPAFVIISRTTWQQRDEARQTAEQLAIKTAGNFAVGQQKLMDDSHRFLAQLAGDRNFIEAASHGECAGFLKYLLRQPSSHFSDLIVTDAQGSILCSANPLPLNVDVSDRSYFQRAMARPAFAVGDYQISRINGKQTMFLALPYFDKPGQAKGIIAAGLNFDWLQQMLTSATLPAGSTLTLVDSTGTILVGYPAIKGQSGAPVPEREKFLELIAGKSHGTIDTIWLDGVSRITFIAQLLHTPGKSIYLRIGIPNDAVFGNIDRQFWTNFFALAASAMLALGLGLVMSEQLLLRRLRDLTVTARRLGAGDLAARPQQTPDHGELGQLAQAFTEMAERLQTHEQHIEHLVTRDGLTGLPNRFLLVERANQAILQAKRDQQCMALAVLDLDRFKFLNDSLGSVRADTLLMSVAERLRNLAPVDAMVAHLGADEFAVLLPDQAQDGGAEAAAAKLSELFLRPFQVMERTIHVSVGIGIALYPSDGDNGDKLLAHARAAVHHIKQNGGNGIQAYTAQMKADAVERLRIEQALSLALKRDELVLHYQPKIDLKTGRMSGMEALLRWNCAELGLVSPARFIPLAEETGLILPIGEWVLQEACRQHQAWRRAGLEPPPVAVNVSARQFWHGDLATTVAQILQETSCSASSLELEVTESVVIHDIDDTVIALEELVKLGITVSLDDFGTGYSSLSYLRRLPLDKLKIDRSFLHNLVDDPHAAMLIREIISIAHTLDLAVITEGVESADEVDFLLDCGCDEVQGYYFSKPLPAEQFQSLLLKQSCSSTTSAISSLTTFPSSSS